MIVERPAPSAEPAVLRRWDLPGLLAFALSPLSPALARCLRANMAHEETQLPTYFTYRWRIPCAQTSSAHRGRTKLSLSAAKTKPCRRRHEDKRQQTQQEGPRQQPLLYLEDQREAAPLVVGRSPEVHRAGDVCGPIRVLSPRVLRRLVRERRRRTNRINSFR